MRRIAFSLFIACGIASLTACGSGGYGFSGGSTASLNAIVFTSGSGSSGFGGAQVNDFFVTASGGIAPLAVSAIGYHGTGPTANVVPDTTFTWTAYYNTSATYTVGNVPTTSKECGKPASQPSPGFAVLENRADLTVAQALGQGLIPSAIYGPPYYVLPAGQLTSEVFVSAVPTSPAFPAAPVLPAEGSTSYCLTLQATHPTDGAVGGVIVVVSNSP
jgi:hypothetical protein